MTYIRANGIVHNIELRGRGEAAVLLPDIGEDLTSWSFQMGLLASRHFILALDPRGSGWSDSPAEPYTVEMMAKDVLSLMDLIGIGKTHLIGHGMGGSIAQAIAAERPGRVRSLTAICTPVRFTGAQRSIYSEWLKAGSEGLDPLAISERITPWIFSSQFLRDPRWRDCVIRGRANQYRRTCWEGARNQLEAMLPHEFPRTEHTSYPALVVWGRDDRLVPPSSARELAERLPGARMVQLEGGHMLPLELVRSLVREELTFMADVDGAPRPCWPGMM